MRACGRSGLQLPPLGLGCWSFGGQEGDYWGAQDEGEVDAILTEALEQGAVYLDTAEMYNEGRSEAALGRHLKGRRERFILGSKVLPNHGRPDLLRQHCEASLRRLDTDYIDLYMLHWPLTDQPAGPVFEALAQLQRAGKIRHVGLSNFGVRQMREAAQAATDAGTTIAANQLCYSLLSRAIEFEILPECQRQGIGVLGYMPLQQGLLTGKYLSADELPPIRARTRHFNSIRPLSRHGEPGAEAEVFQAVDSMRTLAEGAGIPLAQLAIYWAANQPGITCVIPGVRSFAQLQDALAGVSLDPPQDLMQHLTQMTETVRNKLGANADYFQSSANSRIH
jgi:myo-inositol catabolism protein IolS